MDDIQAGAILHQEVNDMQNAMLDERDRLFDIRARQFQQFQAAAQMANTNTGQENHLAGHNLRRSMPRTIEHVRHQANEPRYVTRIGNHTVRN